MTPARRPRTLNRRMAEDPDQDPGGLPATTFFSRTFDEALGLVVEARNYLAGKGDVERLELDPAASLLYSCESLRLTTRLTQIMAWLLVQRAVHEGEVSRERAREPGYRLGARDVCLGDTGIDLSDLPRGLRSLLERSERLYRRIDRLDEMVRRDRG